MIETPKARILVADDEPLFLRTTGELLRKAGYVCLCVPDGSEARKALSSQPFDLVLSDLDMPGNAELELLRDERTKWPDIPLIVVTGVPSLPSAIESLRLGIADYLLKPVKREDLLGAVRRALKKRLHGLNRASSKASSSGTRFPEIVGASSKMLEVFETIERIAETDVNVLITGESGTGKEIVARAIHRRSARAEQTFQTIDCTSIPESLFESMLFGHTKGSFTGAVKDQVGLMARADQGTAFFDEIGELSEPLQAKLLRLIQEQMFTPVGKSAPTEIDTRFICATNRDLELEISVGRFRRDLYYRLAVIHLELPPLRDRGDDVISIAEHFLSSLGRTNLDVKRFSGETIERLRRYSWPGNIRELRNAVERALALSQSDVIEIADLPLPLRRPDATNSGAPEHGDGASARLAALGVAERDYLVSLLKRHSGNVSRSAREAGMSRQGLHKLLSRHEISASTYRN